MYIIFNNVYQYLVTAFSLQAINELSSGKDKFLNHSIDESVKKFFEYKSYTKAFAEAFKKFKREILNPISWAKFLAGPFFYSAACYITAIFFPHLALPLAATLNFMMSKVFIVALEYHLTTIKEFFTQEKATKQKVADLIKASDKEIALDNSNLNKILSDKLNPDYKEVLVTTDRFEDEIRVSINLTAGKANILSQDRKNEIVGIVHKFELYKELSKDLDTDTKRALKPESKLDDKEIKIEIMLDGVHVHTENVLKLRNIYETVKSKIPATQTSQSNPALSTVTSPAKA